MNAPQQQPNPAMPQDYSHINATPQDLPDSYSQQRILKMLLGVAAVIIVLLLVVIALLVAGNSSDPDQDTADTTSTGQMNDDELTEDSTDDDLDSITTPEPTTDTACHPDCTIEDINRVTANLKNEAQFAFSESSGFDCRSDSDIRVDGNDYESKNISHTCFDELEGEIFRRVDGVVYYKLPSTAWKVWDEDAEQRGSPDNVTQRLANLFDQPFTLGAGPDTTTLLNPDDTGNAQVAPGTAYTVQERSYEDQAGTGQKPACMNIDAPLTGCYYTNYYFDSDLNLLGYYSTGFESTIGVTFSSIGEEITIAKPL